MILPKVTIGIPTYNQSEYIAKAVESSLSQTYANLEVIVSDDSESDSTKDVLQKYTHDSRFKYIRNAKPLGRVQNYRELLYEYATGEWYVNLDGDDYYCDDYFIEVAMSCILKETTNILFYQATHLEIQAGNINLQTLNQESPPVKISANEYFFKNGSNYFSHLSTLYNREIALACGFYDLNILVADFYSIMKMCVLSEGDVIIHKKVVGYWINHHGNASKSFDYTENFNNLKCIENLSSLALKIDKFKKSEVLDWQRTMLLKWIFIFRFKVQDLILQTKSKSVKLGIIKGLNNFNDQCYYSYKRILISPKGIMLLTKLELRLLAKTILNLVKN